MNGTKQMLRDSVNRLVKERAEFEARMPHGQVESGLTRAEELDRDQRNYLISMYWRTLLA
jgi:hypothetical protein